MLCMDKESWINNEIKLDLVIPLQVLQLSMVQQLKHYRL